MAATKRIGRIATAGLIASLLILTMGSPAKAFSWTGDKCYGSVGLTKISAWESWSTVALNFNKRTASRSQCSTGIQRVYVTYKVWEFNGQTWVRERESSVGSYRLGYNQYANLGPYSPSVAFGVPYRVTMMVEWYTDSGVYLGRIGIDADRTIDYACGSMCHHWSHPYAGVGVMVCSPCVNTWGGSLLD